MSCIPRKQKASIVNMTTDMCPTLMAGSHPLGMSLRCTWVLIVGCWRGSLGCFARVHMSLAVGEPELRFPGCRLRVCIRCLADGVCSTLVTLQTNTPAADNSAHDLAAVVYKGTNAVVLRSLHVRKGLYSRSDVTGSGREPHSLA